MQNPRRTQNKEKIVVVALLIGTISLIGLSIFLSATIRNNQSSEGSSAGAGACTYSSTETRVQSNTSQPWVKSISIKCGQAYRIAGFHNGTGVATADMSLVVTDPAGKATTYNSTLSGIDLVTNSNSPGTYTVAGTTRGQTGAACENTAKVICTQDQQQNACTYQSTQALVQKAGTSNWVGTLNLNCGEKFKIGGFHNNTSSFANDIKFQLTSPSGSNTNPANGQTITTDQPGNYTITASTTGGSGAACTGSVTVTCSTANQGSGTATGSSSTCSYSSTQARVKLPNTNNWVKNLNIPCTGSFAVGSFHNFNSTLATDTTFILKKPDGSTTNLNSGQTFSANQTGSYILTVSTKQMSGAACTDTAMVVCPLDNNYLPDTAIGSDKISWIIGSLLLIILGISLKKKSKTE